MNLKKSLVLVMFMGFVVASVFAQSDKPRAGQYLFENSNARHWIQIIDEGDNSYEINIVSTNSGLNNGVRITNAYWRPGSGAIEFTFNGRTVQIRAVSGGRSISCTLFGSTVLPRM